VTRTKEKQPKSSYLIFPH